MYSVVLTVNSQGNSIKSQAKSIKCDFIDFPCDLTVKTTEHTVATYVISDFT
jgi:hypothetical protein